MAWTQDAELLAAYALTGAFLTPVLLSTGGDHEIFLFTYIAAIDICTLALVRWKPWPRLLLATLAGTISFFIGWYTSFYPQVTRVYQLNDPYHPLIQPVDQPFALTVAFTLLFFVLFLLPTIRGFLKHSLPSSLDPLPSNPRQSSLILDILLPLSTAAFASLALYSLFEDSLRHDLLPWLMVAFAAAYLALMRLQRTSLSAALHLALAIIFLTIAIPLKASGHTLTIAWLIEGLALLWASTRIPKPAALTPDLLTPSSVLRFLSFAGYTLGFLALFVSRFWFSAAYTPTFFNTDLASALVGIAVFAGAAYLGLHAVLSGRPALAWLPVAFSDFLAIDAIALLLTLREITLNSWSPGLKTAFANPDFFTALVGLAILALTTYHPQPDLFRTPHPRRPHRPRSRHLRPLQPRHHPHHGARNLRPLDPVCREPAAFSGYQRISYALRRLAARAWLPQAQRLHPLAGPHPAPLHRRQGLPL